MLAFDEEVKIWRVNSSHPMGELLNVAIDTLTKACRAKQKTAVVFDATLKDEVVPLDKIVNVKTRIVLGAPMEFTIVHRKYLAALGVAISQLHNEIPIKVGINQYTEWDILYKRLLQTGDYGMDADFKSWDTTVPTFCIRLCGILYAKLSFKLGFTISECSIIEGIYNHICDPLLSFHGKLHLCNKGMPSGQPFTAIDNSVINWAITLVAWKRSCNRNIPRPLCDYTKYIELAVYGDDNMMSVEKDTRDTFGLGDLQGIADDLGMVVTSAQKDGEALGYQHITSLSFLSRSFVVKPQEHRGMIVGRLKSSSLYKLVGYIQTTKRSHFRRNKGDVCRNREQLQELIDMAAIEATMLGRSGFNLFREEMFDGAINHGIEVRISSFNEINERIFG